MIDSQTTQCDDRERAYSPESRSTLSRPPAPGRRRRSSCSHPRATSRRNLVGGRQSFQSGGRSQVSADRTRHTLEGRERFPCGLQTRNRCQPPRLGTSLGNQKAYRASQADRGTKDHGAADLVPETSETSGLSGDQEAYGIGLRWTRGLAVFVALSQLIEGVADQASWSPAIRVRVVAAIGQIVIGVGHGCVRVGGRARGERASDGERRRPGLKDDQRLLSQATVNPWCLPR